MVKKMLLPQEIEVFYILPAIRKSLSKEMIKIMKQKEIAEIFGITEAGVSQYMNNKRACGIKFPKEIEDEIKKSANKITNKESYLKETQKILRHVRSTKEICNIHKKFSFVPCNCDCKSVGCHKQ